MKKTSVILVMASFVLFGVLGAGNAKASDNIVGLWIFTNTFDPPGPPDPRTSLVTITKEGNVLTSGAEFGSGNGLWEKAGTATYASKTLYIVPEGFDPSPPGSIATRTLDSAVLDKGGNEATGRSRLVVTNPTTGTVLLTLTGSLVANRVTLDGP